MLLTARVMGGGRVGLGTLLTARVMGGGKVGLGTLLTAKVVEGVAGADTVDPDAKAKGIAMKTEATVEIERK